MSKKYKLNFELVPDGCWYSNLRTILSKKQWDFLRQDAKERAGGKCMICGRKTDRLEAHERWSYDEANAVQKLEDIVSICHDCHRLGTARLLFKFAFSWQVKTPTSKATLNALKKSSKPQKASFASGFSPFTTIR